MRRFTENLSHLVGCRLNGLPPVTYERQAAEMREILKDLSRRLKAAFPLSFLLLVLLFIALMILTFLMLKNIP